MPGWRCWAYWQSVVEAVERYDSHFRRDLVLGSVLGGYVLSGGVLMALWQPYELIIIAGPLSAVSSFPIR